MRKYILIVVPIVITFMVFTNMAGGSASNSCTGSIEMVNDSVYILNGFGSNIQVDHNIMMGTPQVVVSNDTILVHGDTYSLLLVARDGNGCWDQKQVNKF